MGITNFGLALLDKYIDLYKPDSVMELGAQNLHIGSHPFPYADTYYTGNGIVYECIDLNGENGAHILDLGIQLDFEYQYPLVTNFGTVEHISRNNIFSWEATYNGWSNIHMLTEIGGVIINENPKHGNWPLHGVSYYSTKFYEQLAEYADYEILSLGEHPCMHNMVDGWEIFCVLRKTGERFPTLEQFKTFDIRQA